MAKLSLDFKKIDLTKVKQFLIARGEKVGLGVVAGVGGLILLSGLWAAFSSDGGKKTEELLTNIEKIRTALKASAKGGSDKNENLRTKWDERESDFDFYPPVPVADPPPPKRFKPTVMAAKAQQGSVTFDYLKGAGIQVHSVIDRAKKQVEVVVGNKKGNPELVTTLSPRRMLIVSLLFPMQEQLIEFQNKLGVAKGELKDDYPYILGLDIVRLEIDPASRKVIKEVDLFVFKESKENKDKQVLEIAPHLDNLLRDAVIDEEALAPFSGHYKPGLMTLMPKLTNGSYPPLKLGSFQPANQGAAAKPDNSKDPQKPTPPAKGSRQGSLDIKTWTELGQGGGGSTSQKSGSVVSRLGGDYPVFDGQREAAARAQQAKAQGGNTPEPKETKPAEIKQPDKKPGDKTPPATKSQVEADPLIRFFDVDLEPGRTYAYKIRVRMLNPNYKKLSEVTIATDADDLELFSDWAETPSFLVPSSSDEVFYYAVNKYEKQPEYPSGPDYTPLFYEEIQKGTGQKMPVFLQKVPFQIHRWFGNADVGQDKYVISDWVVAERILVRRGEYIGRRELSVPACTWSKLEGDFVVLNPPKLSAPGKGKGKDKEKPMGNDKDKKKEDRDGQKKPPLVPPAGTSNPNPAAPNGGPAAPTKPPEPSGIKLDFAVTDAMLVDFDGGPKSFLRKSSSSRDFEETAIDTLILNPDGSLSVHNTHRDFVDQARIDRETQYRDRIRHYVAPTPDIIPPIEGKKDPGTKPPDKKDKILPEK